MVLRLLREFVLTLLPIRHSPLQCFPKGATVVAFAEMNKFMHNNVIQESNGKLEDFPVKVQHSMFTT